jgi:hypothetical protein
LLLKTLVDSDPDLDVNPKLTFDEVWEVLFRAGFLYPEKMAKLQPMMAQVRQTFDLLLNDNDTLLRTLVIRCKGVLCGHISMLRAFRQTWMVQHLAACRESAAGLATGRKLTLAVTQVAERSPEMQWAKIFFRSNNKWPARVFGDFAATVYDPDTSDLRTYNYLTAPADVARPRSSNTRNAGPRDFAIIESYFIERGRRLAVEADDLTHDHLTLAGLSAEYSRLALERRREVIVGERHGRVIGFALLEVSAAGLNLSELTNAFSVHMIELDPEVTEALIEAARTRYSELGRTSVIALAEDEGVSALEQAGFTCIKQYCCWCFHRSIIPQFHRYLLRIFHAE